MPTYQEIPYQKPSLLFQNFADNNGAILLESSDYALNPHDNNRYSYIVFNPFCTISLKNKILMINDEQMECEHPFEFLKTIMNQYSFIANPELPPFQGGLVGYFSYDLCHYLEKIPSNQKDDIGFDDLAVGLYDQVISFDHLLKRCFIVSIKNNNLPQQDLPSSAPLGHLLPVGEGVIANFDKEQYLASVERILEYIRVGDIFQANLTQRFQTHLPKNFSSYHLYQKITAINPASFSAYCNLNNTVLVSVSPEKFLSLEHGKVETQPIKGTIRRGKNETEDQLLMQQLATSEKDRAENTMIVDLLRNDLSKVCTANSVHVTKHCALETFPTVHHLVSTVEAKLKAEYHALDLLKACFPGGSITGAPKIRSMQIIAELEPTKRGPYCGSLAYIGFDGCMNSSILIRTYAIKDNVLTFQAGGGIVLDSVAEKEYEESLLKAQALKKALALNL